MGPASNVLVDYAMPLIRMEKLLREIHDHCLHGRFVEANESNLLLFTESRVLSATLAIMDADQKKNFK